MPIERRFCLRLSLLFCHQQQDIFDKVNTVTDCQLKGGRNRNDDFLVRDSIVHITGAGQADRRVSGDTGLSHVPDGQKGLSLKRKNRRSPRSRRPPVFLCGEKTEKAVFATFLSVFQIIPAASFVKITKSPETIVVSGLLTMVRGTGLEPVTPCTSSMCSTS